MVTLMRLTVIIGIALTTATICARVWVSNILSYQVARSDLFVPNGASATRVLKDLAPNLSVTERKFLFFLYPFFSHVQAGFYRFPRASSVIEALKSINDGNAVVNRVTVPEGITSALLFEQLGGIRILDGPISLEQERWLKLSDPFAHNEGAFLAETYLWQQQMTRNELLELMHRALEDALKKAWIDRDPIVDTALKSPYELLILASIVEKETALASERAVIAGVLIERLKRGMRLQTDPTVIYGLGHAFKGNLTRRHLREKTAYNTYRIDRLPPTPIALVGPEALHAVARPKMTGALYFVADGSGGHAFAKTLKEHNANVRKYQLKR
ncbi:endolytic transglycosylase MltG [Litorivicinus sp.]|jgi:UPF0755 protein|nr:endolytic transglycosylase MltG [Litorivicinus sp.]MDC1240033.1 endolytic transglycosylase MltG [Litorivicinus sp.]MDC1319305.1 endolytic transglycosylase MltG [Litorivicinus sp.]|tara:strand:- start:33544 stop:34527 length:984 start_codon:yes stop_codon:yes gene_type:complete